jgi:Zn finger protein HypA/HybF involved in hydrogenase expression
MAEQQIKKQNPLSQWFRQPKVYIKLPSNGEFYPHGALDKSENGEYPVYAMNAKDELMFKTPDALLTGQSTVEVIKSCIPAIQDPWSMPSIDLDVALVAIRIATYGQNMEVNANCPHCKSENSYDVDLVAWLSTIGNFEYQTMVNCDPLMVHVRPYSYQELSKTNIKTLEQQRLFNTINDDSLSDEQKLDIFGKSFVRITELTVDVIAGCIKRIDTPDGFTDNPAEIKEFINNASKDIFDKIAEHIQSMKKEIEFKPMDVKCQDCEKPYEMPITMDQSNFFNVRS